MTFLVYKDNVNQYRWRLFAGNNRIIADSGEGYYNKTDCLHGIQLVQQHAAAADVQDQTVATASGSRW